MIPLPSLPDIATAYDKAPQYIKDFMDGDTLTTVFQTLRSTYKLHIDDSGTLALLMNTVLLGLLPLGQFETALAEHIPNLKPDQRVLLAKEVNEKVFVELRKHATARTESATTTHEQTSVAQPPITLSIVTQKLSVPSTERPEEITVIMPDSEAKQTSNPRYSGGSDPYREPTE